MAFFLGAIVVVRCDLAPTKEAPSETIEAPTNLLNTELPLSPLRQILPSAAPRFYCLQPTFAWGPSSSHVIINATEGCRHGTTQWDGVHTRHLLESTHTKYTHNLARQSTVRTHAVAAPSRPPSSSRPTVWGAVNSPDNTELCVVPCRDTPKSVLHCSVPLLQTSSSESIARRRAEGD